MAGRPVQIQVNHLAEEYERQEIFKCLQVKNGVELHQLLGVADETPGDL